MISHAIIRHIKEIISNTPLNRNYIAAVSIKKRLKEAAPYVKGTVLDVGCGKKPYEIIFRSQVLQYIGLDQLNEYPDAFEGADIFGDTNALPFRAGVFDTVICTQVLSHIEQPHQAFGEFKRVLKHGGVLLVTAAKSWERRTGLPIPDYFRFTDEGLTVLARHAQLEVLYTKECCGFFATIGQLLARFLNKEFIYRKTMHEKIDTRPNILLACFILPLCCFVQIIFLCLDKLYYSKLDTLSYIILARKIGRKV